MVAYRRVDPKVIERPFPELIERGTVGRPHVVADLQCGAQLRASRTPHGESSSRGPYRNSCWST
jgi:hypothetical protein